MSFKKISSMLALTALLLGCGDQTSIQTGEVGKQLTSNGLENEIRQPGAFRMDSCGFGACPKLVRLQVNKSTADLEIDSLFLPKSNVDLSKVQIGLQFQVKPNKDSINKVFTEVRPEPSKGQYGESDRVLVITAEMVYATYLKRKAPDAIVTALRNYSVEEVLTNVPEIAQYAKEQVNKMLAETPIEVTELGFPNGIGEVPKEVIEAKRRLFAIEEEKARKIKALEAELAVEDQRQAVQRKRSKNDMEIAGQLGISVSEFMRLKIAERFSDAAEAGTPVALGGQFVPMGKK